MFQQFYYSIRNYAPKHPPMPLGRWNRKNNIEITSYLANKDSCFYSNMSEISEYISKALLLKNQKKTKSFSKVN